MIIFICYSLIGNGQSTSLLINFNALFNEEPLSFDKDYTVGSTVIQVNRLRFYVSNINLFDDENQIIFKEKDSYHLIDFAKGNTSIILEGIDIGEFYKLQFLLGIDSLTNDAGVKGGDLDPINGMYWSWQSGYINLKLEGSFKSNEEVEDFQFHLGGFLPPFYNAHRVEIYEHSWDESISVFIDIAEVLKEIDLSTFNKAMSPSEKAVKLNARFASKFYSKNEK